MTDQFLIDKFIRLTFKLRSAEESKNQEEQIIGVLEINIVDYVSATTSNLNIYNNIILSNENNKILQNVKCSFITRSLITRTPVTVTTKIEDEDFTRMELNTEAEEKFSQNQIELQHQKWLFHQLTKGDTGAAAGSGGGGKNNNEKIKKKKNEKNAKITAGRRHYGW
jgi:hypothetical protein